MSDVDVHLEVIVHLQDENGELSLLDLTEEAFKALDGRHGTEIVAILDVRRKEMVDV